MEFLTSRLDRTFLIAAEATSCAVKNRVDARLTAQRTQRATLVEKVLHQIPAADPLSQGV